MEAAMEARLIDLPAGFRFEPTARELILLYLRKKVNGEAIPYLNLIQDCDIYGSGDKEPWKIFGTTSANNFYMFTKLIKKKVESKRVERTAGCGTWKLQQSEEIKEYYGRNNKKQKTKEVIIGYKKLLVFEVKLLDNKNLDNGHWLMHEYSLPNDESGYVLCEIRNKNAKVKEEDTIFDIQDVEHLIKYYKQAHHTQTNTTQQQQSYFEATSNYQQQEFSSMITPSSPMYRKRVRELYHDQNHDADDGHEQHQQKRFRSTTTTDDDSNISTILFNLGEGDQEQGPTTVVEATNAAGAELTTTTTTYLQGFTTPELELELEKKSTTGTEETDLLFAELENLIQQGQSFDDDSILKFDFGSEEVEAAAANAETDLATYMEGHGFTAEVENLEKKKTEEETELNNITNSMDADDDDSFLAELRMIIQQGDDVHYSVDDLFQELDHYSSPNTKTN